MVDEAIRAQEAAMLDDITCQLARFGKERKHLIPMLQMIQERHAYLAPEALNIVTDHLQMSVCEVYGVATFYNQFRFHPPGKHHIKVCLGTACHVRGGDIILENFERKLEINEGGNNTRPGIQHRKGGLCGMLCLSPCGHCR